MAETQTPQNGKMKEGDFFFVAGYGLAMAHYPMRDKNSRFYEDTRPKRKGRGQTKTSESKMDRSSLMLVSLLPTQKPMLHDPKTEGVLFPIPSPDELDEAVLITAQREPGTELTEDLFAELTDSGKLSDIARIGRIIAGKPNTEETKGIFRRSVDIIGSVHFYHSVISKDPRKARILTAKTATRRFSDAYYDSFEELLAKGKSLTGELEASGTQYVEVEEGVTYADAPKAAASDTRKDDAPTKQDALEKPENGTLHYLLGKGVVVAHYPAQSSKSLHAGKGEALLVSLVPGAGSSPMSDKNLADLRPIPSLEDMDKALVEANKSPPQALFTNQGYFDGLLKSENLRDVAKAGSFANKDPNNPLFSRAAVNSFSIMTGIDLYHRELAGKTPEAVTKLITTKARNDQHKRKYAVSAEIVINRAAETLNGLVNIGQASADATFIEETADAVKAQKDGGKRVTADTAKAKGSPEEAEAKTADQPANPDKKPAQKISKKAARKAAKALQQEEGNKDQGQSKPEITDKQREFMAEALEMTQPIKGIENDGVKAARRLHELFEVGKVGFQDAYILMRQVFAHPVSDPNDTLKKLNEAIDGLGMDKTGMSAAMKRLKKQVKNKFGNAAKGTPDSMIHDAAFDWRPPAI